MKKYFINQIKKKDCAFASLKILLANIYKRNDFLYIPQNKEDKSYSLKEIIEIASKYGIVLKGYKSKEKDFDDIKNKPCLVNIIKNESLHMIVLFKVKKNKVLVADPDESYIWLNKDIFLNSWTGDFLEVEEILGSDFKLEKKKNKLDIFVVSSLAIELVAFFALTFGFYSCNKDINFLIPLALFLIFAVLQIIYRRVLIKGMKKFDEEIMEPAYLVSRNQLTDCLIDMNNYKKITFSSPLNLFSIIFTLIFSTIILGVNSYLNLVNVLIILFFQVSIYFIFNSYFKDRKKNLINIENKLNDTKLSEEDFKENLRNLNKETYSISTLYDIKKYVSIFLSITLSMILFGLNSTSGLNFIIFHAFFYIYINDNLEKLINFGDDYNEYKKYKCKYLNYIG